MIKDARYRWNMRRSGWIIIDAVLSACAIAAAYALHPLFPFGWTTANVTQPAAVPATLAYPWYVLLCGHVAGLHDPLGDRRRWFVLLRISLVVVGALGMFLAVLYSSSLNQLGRLILLQTFVFNVSLLGLSRVLVWNLENLAPRRIGCYLSSERLSYFEQLVRKHHTPLILVTAPAPNGNSNSKEEIAAHFRSERVEEVIVSSLEQSELHRDVWLACLNRGMQVTDVSVFCEREYYKVPCDQIGLSWVLSIDLKWNHPFYHRFKRIVDVLAATVGLCISAPLIALATAAIFIETGRPILYSQVRVGFQGKNYRIWKLRTMTTDAERDGAKWAIKGDARITRVGNILRRSRIDELPQFWNVLIGNMSLIGPRPERPEFVGKLSQEIPLYMQRHWMKPGITGWAQINFSYGASIADAQEKLCYDLFYLKNASLLLDMHITLRTIGVLMKGSR